MRQSTLANGSYPLTELLLDAARSPRIEGIVVGTLRGFDGSGSPCVDFPGNGLGDLPARSTVALSPEHKGREVALVFEAGDPQKPIVLGLINHPVPVPEATADGERLVFTAEKEIELRCGKASISLTKAGKILIRGEYVLSRSAGVNRIKGGSVQIN
jgi:hypothetical protein